MITVLTYMQTIEIDNEGLAICPDCGARVNLGTVGLSNLTKRHRGTKKCLELKAKREKKGKEKVQGSLLTFMKPKPTLVPSTVESIPLVPNTRIPMSDPTDLQSLLEFEPADNKTSDFATTQKPPVNKRSRFIEKLESMVKRIPNTVPEGSENDRLALFGGNPRNQDITGIDADELWEANLNQFLKGALGWGTEDTMDDVVRRGRNGMDGVLEFARFFIEDRGVNEGLFEGKLSHLVNAVERM